LSSPPICPGPWCVQFRGTSSSLLCPVPRCVQTIGVSSSLVSPNPWCVQFLSVSRSLVCPYPRCVQVLCLSGPWFVRSLVCQVLGLSRSLKCSGPCGPRSLVYTVPSFVQFLGMCRSRSFVRSCSRHVQVLDVSKSLMVMVLGMFVNEEMKKECVRTCKTFFAMVQRHSRRCLIRLSPWTRRGESAVEFHTPRGSRGWKRASLVP
jgi:hypothetical protein